MSYNEDNLPWKSSGERFSFSKKLWKIERAKLSRKIRADRTCTQYARDRVGKSLLTRED